MSGEILEGSAAGVASVEEPDRSPQPPSRPKPLYPQPSCGGDLFEGRVAPAPPPSPYELLRRSLSLFLILSLLSSSFPVLPVAASEVPSPPSPYPLFENTENEGGVIRLLPGQTSGCFVSVPIEGEIEGALLFWEENEPSLPAQPGPPGGKALAGESSPSSENPPESSCMEAFENSSPPPDDGSPGAPSENSSPEPENLEGPDWGAPENLAPETSPFQNLHEFDNASSEGFENSSPENLPSEGQPENSSEPENFGSGGLENLAPETSPPENCPGIAEENSSPENLPPSPPENSSPEPETVQGPENDGSGGSETPLPNNSPEVVGENSAPQVPSENLTAEGPYPETPGEGSGEAVQENGGQENGPEGGAGVCAESGIPAEGTPAGSEVSLQVRVSQDGESWSEWMGPEGPGTFFTSPPADLSFLPLSRYLQFRVFLRSGDPRLSGENGPRAWGFRISAGERDLSEESESWLENFLALHPRGKYVRVERLGAEGGEVQSSFPLLRRIRLKPARPVRGVVVAASPLESLPEGVPELEGRRVLAYLEISTSLPRGLLRSAELEFSVPRWWLAGNAWKGSRVAVYHFDGSWEELPTRELGENSSEITFLATTPGFSVFAFVDNTDLDFSQGFHENTENVDNYVRLISGYTLGRFTARVFDAGGIAQWDNLEWSFTEPEAPASDIDYVEAEPDVLKDGSGRVGTQWQGTYENTRYPDDGSYENLSETGAAGGVTYTVMESNDNETVFAGGVINTENAREPADTTEAGGTNYENIHENAYVSFGYTYAQTYKSSRGEVENFPYQQQEAGGYATYVEGGVIVYSQQEAIAVYSTGAEVPSAKRWTGTEWVAMPTPNAVAGTVQWVVVKSARTRNELILGILDSSGDISLQIWNGVTGGWSEPYVVSNVGTTVDAYRCFDIEYENGNDRAIVVFNMDNNTDNLYYVIWDGNSWSDPLPIDVPTTGIPYWVELASNPLPDNNDILMIMLDSNRNVWGAHWNGSAWDDMGNPNVWDTSASIATRKAIDVAYEYTTGDGMFVWADSVATDHYYRTWTGGVLSDPTLLDDPNAGSITDWIQLVADPLSDDLIIGLQNEDTEVNVAFWNGSSWGAVSVLEGGIESAADQSFALTFQRWPGREGYVWAFFGEGALLGRREYTGSWSAKSTSGDDTARVVLQTHWFDGTILGVVMGDDSAGGSYDGIYPIWSTSPGSWSNLTATERWVVSELPANPIFERAGISCRRHWPVLYGLEVYENVDNIPLAENYFLEIYYKLSNTFDKFHVEVENSQSPGTWVRAGDLTKDVWTLFSYQLHPDFLFGGENVHIRIIDNDNTKESITNIYVDFVRVKGSKPGYNLDVVHTLMAPTGAATYTLEVEYYTIGDSENVAVYLWDFDVGQWVKVGELISSTPTQWTFNLTGTPYLLGTGKVKVRYVQSDVATALDTTITSFMLNYTRVKSTTAAGQSLDWQYTITGVTSGYENYDLKIRGYSYNDLEYIWIEVWNVVSESWEPTQYYLPRNAPSTITFRLSPLDNYLDGDNVYIKLRDDSPSDATTTYVIIDMIRLEEAFWGTSDVKLQLRVSGDNLTWTDWMGPDGTPNTYFESTVTSMENIPDNRYIQYRIYFWANTPSLSGASGPRVDWVRINASSLPNLIYPVGGISLSNPQPTFQWETVSADNYRLQIATDPDFANLIVDNSSIPGTENSWTPPSPLPDNFYYWRIQRYFNNSWYAWTSTETFRIDTLPPGPPTLLSPSDGEVLNDNTPLLDWDPPEENSYPLLYQVWIAYDSAFLNSVPGYPTDWISADNYEVPSPGLPDNTYYWKVRAMDNAGNPGSWPTAYRSFRIDITPPQVPTQVWPAPAQWTRALPNLDWDPVSLENDGDTELSLPVLYEVQVSQDPTFGTGVYSSGWIPDDNWIAVYCYENNTVWYWRVRARDNAGTGNMSEWSAPRSFRVDNECPQVQLYWPEDGSVFTDQLSLTLQWCTLVDGGSGLENYRIQIDDSPDFSSPLVDTLLSPSENSYSYEFPGIGTYWWRVRGIDAVGNEGEWSETRSLTLRCWFLLEGWTTSPQAPITGWRELEGWLFSGSAPAAWFPLEGWTDNVSAPVPAPVLLSPENGKNLSTRQPTLTWENLQPADSYWIWVDNDPDFSSLLVSKAKTVPNYSFSEDFLELEDGVYYWRVRMTRSGVSSENSETWCFRVDLTRPSSPLILSPIQNENLGTSTPTVRWENVTTEYDGSPEYSLPLTYQVIVDNDPDFTSPEHVSPWILENQYTLPALPDNLYRVRVRARDNAGNVSDNAEVVFRVDTKPPPTPTILWPKDDAWTTTTPNLRWTQVEDNSEPVRYHVQIATENWSDATIVVQNDQLYGENWVVSPALTQGYYYWRIRAIDNAGNPSPFSSAVGFRVDATPPPQVQLYFPENQGAFENGALVTLVWQTALDTPSGTENYWIQISTDSSFTLLLVDENQAYPDNDYVYVFPGIGTYYWRVKAVDKAGNPGPWSEIRSVRICTWRSLEGWTAAVGSVPAFWQGLEGWTVTVASVPPSWRMLEGWSCGVSAPAGWHSLDSWTSTVPSFPVLWHPLESWSGTVASVPLYWHSLDSWTSTVPSFPVLWHPLESWGVAVFAPASWRAVESWSGQVGTPVSWYPLEACTGSLSAPVPAPVLLSPPNGENMRETTPTLEWDNLQPADYYWFQVATDNDFTNVVVEFTGWVGKSYTHVGGFTDGLYYWRVCQTRTGVTGPWSETWTFRVDTLPPASPTVTFPTDNLNLGYPNPTIRWIPPEENSLPLTYDLWVDNDPDFGSQEVSSLHLTENSYTLPSLPDGLYYLRVRAVDNAGNPGENAQLRFRIDTVPPVVPQLVSPSPDVWVSENVVLDWEPVQENSTPVMYRVQLSIYSDFATLERDSGWIYEDNWTVTPPLVSEYRYYWRVKARDNALGPNGENGNESPWSAVRSFRLDAKPPSVPSPFSPSPEASTDNLTVRFEWVRAYDDYDNPNDPWSSGVAYYLIQVAEDRSFASPVLENTVPDNSCYLTLPAYGRYYWRVRAVDAVGHEGDWSENRPFHVGRWLSLEGWISSTQNVPLGWLELEGWMGEASTVVSWGKLEGWFGTVISPASWNPLEGWSIALAFPASWNPLEGWTVDVSTPVFWLSLEGWTGAAFTVVSWVTLEGISGTVRAPVPAPLLLSPPDKSGYAGTLVTFEWDNLQAADYYNLQIDDENTFSSPLLDTTTASKQYTYDLPGTGTYYWRVRQYRNPAWSDWSEAWRVSVDITPPAPPALVSPRNWENLNDNTPLLDWEPVEENSYPVKYDVLVFELVSQDLVRSATLYDLGTGENTQWEIAPPLPDGRYYWKVYATDNAGNSSPASEERYFRVDTLPPAPPQLDFPPDNHKTNQTSPQLSWYEVEENSKPVLYYASVSDSSSFPYENENSGWMGGTSWTPSLSDGHWYWRVKAKDNAGNEGPWSEVRLLVVDVDPPAPPVSVYPENNLKTNDNTVFFDWLPVENEVTGAEEDSPPLTYYVSISDSPSFLHENFGSGWVDTDNWESFPLPDGVWYWRVCARDNAGNEGPWSEVRRFTLDTSRPTPPSPVSPRDGENLGTLMPTLRWENSFDLTEVVYKVWVSTDNLFQNVVRESDWIPDNYWVVTPALEDNLYYWRVCARDNAGNVGENSAPRSFRVDTLPPENVFLIWPDNGINVGSQPNLDWNPAVDNSLPVRYRVLINRLGLTENYRDSGWILPDNWVVTPSLSDNDYEWRVLARDNAGNVFETEVRWFRVETQPPAAPQLYSPLEGENTRDNTPFLSWENVWDVSRPVMFYAWVAEDNAFTNVVRERGWSYENGWEVTPALQDGVYYWRVCARDNVGNVGENSAPRSFRVDTLPPAEVQLGGPENAWATENLTVSFWWYPVEENSLPVVYTLQVGRDPDFQDAENLQTTENHLEHTLPEVDHYYWRVRARDNAGNEGPWSETRFLMICRWRSLDSWQASLTAPAGWRHAEGWQGGVTAAPLGWGPLELWDGTAGSVGPAPLLLSPPDGVKTRDNRTTFRWENTDLWEDGTYVGWRADSWEIWIDNTPNFDNSGGRLVRENTVENFYVPVLELPDENYFWRVRGWFLGFASPFSSTFTLLVDTLPPTVPLKLGPSDGYITTNLTVTLNWSLSSDSSRSPTGENAGVAHYELIVDDDFALPYAHHDNALTSTTKNVTLSPGIYRWIVRAWDWAGNVSENEAPWTFIIDTAGPSTPTPLEPAGTKTNGTLIYFDWTDATDDYSGVDHYHLQVDNDPDFTSPEYEEWPSASYLYLQISSDENYSWRVRAIDRAGNPGNWSAVSTFLRDTCPPSAPSLSSPSDGHVTENTTLTFTWSLSTDTSYSPTGESAGVWRYEVWVDNDPNFTSPELRENVNHPENSLQAFLSDENYSWRVRAWDEAGNAGPWSQTWSFIVDTTPPEAPLPQLPENGGMRREAQVTFTWSVPEDLSGIASYVLFVDNDEDFSSPSSYLVTTNAKTVTLTDEKYYWRVRATDRAGNTGENSVTYSFLLDTLPPQVTALGTPVDGLVTRENVQTFSWSYVQDLSNSPTGEVAGVVAYELWIDNDDDFSSPYLQENLTENFREVELPDENWFWRVRVWDNAGNFSTSEVRSLLVDTRPPDVPAPLSPSDGARINDNRPVFSWSAVMDRSWSPTGENSGVRCYELWVDNDPGFTSPEVLENVEENSYQPSFLPDELYSWRVRAWDWAGNASDFSPTRTLLIDTVAPPAPPKVDVSPDTGVDDPPQGVVTKENGVTLYWQEVQDISNSPTGENAGVRWYEVTLENVATGHRISENVTGTSLGLTVLEGEWRWWVRAWDWAGNVSENEAPWILIVDLTPPNPPAPVSPASGAITNNYSIRFDWQDGWDPYGIPSEGAYTIQVDNSPSFSETSPYFKSATVSLSERTFIFYAGGAPQDERYYWRVKVKDNAGNESDWSEVWDVLLDTLPPDVPSKAYPENNAILNDNRATLAWGDVVDRSRSPSGDVAGLACYELWVATDGGFTQLVLRENLTSSSRDLELPDNRYYWRVRAWDRANNASDFEAPFTFVVDVNPPPAPSLLSPENGLVTKDNRPEFRWTQVYDVTGVSYELWVDNDPGFTSPEVLENVEENSYQPSGLGDELYYWRVRAWDGLMGGERKAGEFSEVRVLLVDTLPPDLPENSPLHGSIVGDKFIPLSWNPVSDRSGSPTGEVAGLSHYEVQVDNDPDFSSVDYAGTTADNVWSSGDPGYPSAGFREDNFYFRARAWDNAGNVPPWTSCTVWNFVVDLTRPYGPALYLPENNAAENEVSGDYVVVDHSWEEVKDASGIDHYEIQVSLNPSFTSLLPSEYFSSNPSHLTSPSVTVFYPYDGRYWWRVRAYDRAAPDQPGEWSQVYELVVDRVKPLTPTLYLPENGKVTSDNTPSFGWENVPDNTSQTEEVSGVDHFVLQLDTTPAFSSPRSFESVRENSFTLPEENSLQVGLWYWRVRAVDRAGNAGDWSGTFILRIEDLVLTLFLSDNAVNPGENLTAYGRASWQPENSPVVGENVEVSLDTVPLENLPTDENGEYSLTLSSTVLGLHTIRVSLTDNQGTTEENELTFKVETLTLTVSLNDYVVNPGQSLTVSGRVERVWENVPETSATVSVYIDDQIAGEGGTNENGGYSVEISAPSSLGPHQLRVRAVNSEGITGENQTSFTVKTLTVSLSLTDTAGNPRSEANPGEALRISGTVRLQPDGSPVTLNPIDLFLDNVLIRTDNTDLWGSYRFDVTAPEEIETYEYRVRITGPEGITGENFTLLTVRRIDISMTYDDGVVNPGQLSRVSGRAVLQPGNEPIQFNKVTFSLFDEEGNWSGGGENFTDADGNYSITFASPSKIGTYYGKASTTVGVFWSENVKELYVKTVRLSLTFDDNIVTLTQNFTMSGEAVLLPDNTFVKNTAVEIRVDGFPETTAYTDENGRYSYLYTKDAPAPSKHTVQVRLVDPEGIVGENTGYFEQRVVTFEWFGTLDSHGQFDGVLNPGENFYLAVRILENNGSEVFPVTMGSTTVKVDGATPSPPGLTHVRDGYWRTYASYTAPSPLGTYVRYLDVSVLTANGISGYVYDQPASYQVKALRLPVLLSDGVVNPGENVTVSGTLTLLPEGTPVENENVVLTFAGQEFVLPTSSTGGYSLTLTAPDTIGRENVRVRVTDRRGLEAENSTTLTVGTLWISLIPQGEVAPEGVPFGFSGRALSLPDLTPASRIDLEVYISGQFVRSVQTLDNGDYSFTHTFPKRGLYEVRVSGVDAEGLRGENSREILAGRPINLRGEVRSLEGTPIPTTFTFYEVGTAEKAFEVSTDENGRYSRQVFAGRFDLEVRFTGVGATLRYENLNLDQLQPYDNLENLVRADTPPSAFTSVEGTRATHRSVVVLLHPIFTDNFSRLTVTFDFSSYLSQVGDIWYLRVYRAEEWDYWTRVRSGTWIDLGGSVDIIGYTITAEDNLRSPTAAYVLAEYDPFATQVLRLENTISELEQATGALAEASGTMSSAAENLKSVVDNMASIVSGLVTQENMKALENTLLSPLQTMSQILENLIALQGTSVGLMENMIDALWSGFQTVWQGIENLRQQEVESAFRLQSLMENAFRLMMENVAPREPITVDPQSLSLELYQEGTADVYLTVKNNAFIPLDLRPSAAGEVKDEDFLAFSPTLLSLNPGETGKIKVSVKIPRKTPPKTYTGEVVIKDTATEKSVPVTIRVLPSARGLFDLKVTPMVRTVSPGGMLPVKVTLINMGEMASETQLFLELLTSAGVTLLPDAAGQSKLVEAGETVTVDASLQVPDTAEEGYYLVKARADYRLNGDVISVSATDTVEVRKYLRADLKMVPPSIAPGRVMRVGVEVKNLGNSSISSLVSVQLVTASGEVVAEATENLTLEAGETRLHTFELRVPENLPEGDYLVKTGGTYLWAGKEFSLTPDQEFMQVRRPPKELKVLGLPLWMLALLLLSLVGMGVAGRFSYRYVKKRRGAKRRFEATLFLNELPQPGPDAIKLGTLAEAKRDAYLKLNDLRMHVITAGATGGGKTISSMVIAEEALRQGKNVIVFDPTAQWTGFLRKCTDERMLSHYPRFGLTEADARSFPGVVKLITNPRQKIDMKELLGEEARGKITVFVIERLKPGDMDVFVTNVIQSIFESQPREHPELKVLLIFDEVHRLLPKYGGSGAGELQLERAVREFRKWGIGVMLVSQTIADFSETIKTNCRTQIQFWTREEGELQRIAAKYGEEHVRSVSRAPIGFGMVVNPDYNRGRPYYVNFRPILHSPFRLSPEELDKYYAADDRIENIKFKLKKLEEKGVDVFDLRIELGLAQRKLEEASFDMVNAYLDSLEPRVDEVCAKHKLKGIKRVIELVPEEEIRRTQMAAIRERERQLAMMKRPPEIVEAYKEILGTKKEVKHGEAEKPLKEEKKEEEMVHPEARGEKLEEAEEKAKGEEKKKNGGKNGGSKKKG